MKERIIELLDRLSPRQMEMIYYIVVELVSL